MADQLPPGAAIMRGTDLDSRVFTLEASLLRLWINMNLEPKDQLKSAEEAQAEQQRKDRRTALAERLLRDQRRAVTDG